MAKASLQLFLKTACVYFHFVPQGHLENGQLDKAQREDIGRPSMESLRAREDPRKRRHEVLGCIMGPGEVSQAHLDGRMLDTDIAGWGNV